MNKLTILVGPPGSGKSTLAKQYEQQGYYRISQDDMGKSGHILDFNVALMSDKNIIIDRMNFSKEQRERYLLSAKKLGYYTEILVLHESRETCLTRCFTRSEHPTIKTTQDANNALNTFFSKYERPNEDEADEVHFWYPDGIKDNAIWVDIDNTLSDATHREHFLQGGYKNWKNFFEAMSEDSVNCWCAHLIEGMSKVCSIIICSARPDNYRKETEEWLKKYNISYDRLIMRTRNDYRRDNIVKEIMYDFEIKTRYNLLFSVDDRKQVIEHMRTRNVVVLDCAGEKGNF